MSKIRTSLHGRQIGLNHNSELQVANGGIVVGNEGNQVRLPSSKAISVFDDFVNSVLITDWTFLEGTDAATSAAALLAGGIGGVLRLTTGDAGTGLAADAEQVVHTLQWKAENGGLAFQTRVKMSAITTCWAFIGFTDVVTLEGAIISAANADTITTNATDAVGFMFDTRMATDNWWLVGVANDVDATAQNSGFAPVADDYETLRIEVNASGVATFFRNGIQVGTTMAGAVTPTVALTPTIGVSKTSVAASMTMDVDYIHVTMDRAADGGAV